MAQDILIVDDEADIRELISAILSDENYQTRTVATGEAALEEISTRAPSLVILDIWLRGSRFDGMEVLNLLRQDYPDLPVVMISGHGTIESAVHAIKLGAYDYIEKPFKTDRLLHVTARAIQAYRLKRENRELRQMAGPQHELIGASAAMTQMRSTMERVAPTNSRIMISGPAGSGKEILARNIHAASGRANAPFVVLNAATMAPERVEIELFGIEGSRENRGDADRRQLGLFEQADGGTLLLDEIADMPLETQGKVLRVLVDQKFFRVGGANHVQVDVRVISSSSKDLQHEISQGRFREDLFHRLNVVPITVPSLSERREDIPELVSYFMARFAQALGRQAQELSPDAMAALQAHDWPGNVRQLRNMVERMLILAPESDAEPISVDMLPAEIGSPTPTMVRDGGAQEIMTLPLREARELFEREYLMAQINRFSGNISRTAEFVGMERSALHRKLKSLGVVQRDANNH